MMNPNSVLLRRGKILIRKSGNTPNPSLAATFNANLESLGYVLAPEALESLIRLPLLEIAPLYKEVLATLQHLKGVHTFKPMYPNFPDQVINASDSELYLNAMTHYFSAWLSDVSGQDMIWLPKYHKETRSALSDKVELRVLRLGSLEDLRVIARGIALSNTSISPNDKEDLAWLIENDHFDMPQNIPNKENMALIAALILKKSLNPAMEGLIINSLMPLFKTATDVLRLSVALSEGDVSLSEAKKFRTFSRSERRVLMTLLEGTGHDMQEDMQRHKGQWLRLGEKLHPGEFKNKFTRTRNAFDALRKGLSIETFNSKVEAALRKGDALDAIALLSSRPGEYARRLDHLLRLKNQNSDLVMETFASVAHKVSTPVLLGVVSHFKNYGQSDIRVVFPKGNTAKVRSLPNNNTNIDLNVARWAERVGVDALKERFSKLPPLHKVYIDENLKDINIPFGARSASKSLRTLERGSKLAFSKDKNTMRFFVWWMENDSRADMDLSAVMYDKNWKYMDEVAYYNLRVRNGDTYSAYHSGDITEAPMGACEFIDVNMDSMQKIGARYVCMIVTSYSRQKFDTLKEISAGWMLRDEPQSGEIFDPSTVTDKIDITNNTTLVMPLVIDTLDRRVIWADVSVRPHRGYQNNVASNEDSITLIGRAMTEIKKTTLFDLLTMHAQARGEIVNSITEADVVFSIENETHLNPNVIASEFMANAEETEKEPELSTHGF